MAHSAASPSSLTDPTAMSCLQQPHILSSSKHLLAVVAAVAAPAAQTLRFCPVRICQYHNFVSEQRDKCQPKAAVNPSNINI